MGDNREGSLFQWNDPSLNSPQPHPYWKIVVKSPNFSEPQFHPLENQDQNAYLIGLLCGSGFAYVKCPVQCLAHSSCGIHMHCDYSLSQRSTVACPSSLSTKTRQKGAGRVGTTVD